MTIVEYSMHFSGTFNIDSPIHYSAINVSGLCKTTPYLTAACLCEWKKIAKKTIKATKNHTSLQLKCSILNNSTLSWELSLTINQYNHTTDKKTLAEKKWTACIIVVAAGVLIIPSLSLSPTHNERGHSRNNKGLWCTHHQGLSTLLTHTIWKLNAPSAPLEFRGVIIAAEMYSPPPTPQFRTLIPACRPLLLVYPTPSNQHLFATWRNLHSDGGSCPNRY